MRAGLLPRLLNHLFAGEPWARQQLQAYAGQSFRVECLPWQGHLRIAEDGLLALATDDVSPSVCVRLPAESLLLFLRSREQLLAQAHITGNVQLAECLAFVFRNLRWDSEADLAKLFGDIAGRRLHQAGQALFSARRETPRRLTTALREYLTHEQPMLLQRPALTDFAARLESLQSAVQAVESRLNRY